MHPAAGYEIKAQEHALEFLERVRWHRGVFCPLCGLVEEAYRLHPTRPSGLSLWKCSGCRRQFTVLLRTPLEGSHLPPQLWLQALMVLFRDRNTTPIALQRVLGITYKSASYILRRLEGGPDSGNFSSFEDYLAELLKRPARLRSRSLQLFEEYWSRSQTRRTLPR